MRDINDFLQFLNAQGYDIDPKDELWTEERLEEHSFKDVFQMLERWESSRWIDVNDRLPKTGEDVLIFTYGQEKEQVVGRLIDSGEWVMELGCNYDEGYPRDQHFAMPAPYVFYVENVTHWQPLPEPQKTA